MTPPAPKASGTPWLARLLSLVFLMLVGFALPQQAAAQDSTTVTAPDRTVDSVSVSSASVVEGVSFTINATVNNEGNAASAATTLTYYRSTDATITTGDTSIATDAVGALAASGSSTQNASVSIATAGTYYVGACVPTVSGETNTDNNCSTGVQVTVTAAVAPTITSQPADWNGSVGNNATFVVRATGIPTPTYQWRKDGTAIPGATSAIYTIRGLALTDAGEYTVVVSNSAGEVTSDAATLTVAPVTHAPVITTHPTNQSVTVGGLATFVVAAGGVPTPTYQWRKDGTDISGATSALYFISSTALTDAGDYTVVVTNTVGEVTSNAATLTVTAPDLTVDSVSVSSASVVEGAAFTINATVNNEGNAASAATTLTYYRSTDATITTDDTSIATDAISILAASGSSTQNASVSIATADTYYVGACVPTVSGESNTNNNCSTGVQVTVTAAVAPQITTQPTDQSVTVGENATFTVTATGTPTPTYQWRFEGSDIAGATSASYTISSAALTNAGDYTVVVTNTAGTVTSTAATLTVTPAAVAPQITTQPTDQSVTVGENATFTVAATGTPAPTYQWHFDGTEISGATSASYTISSAALTNAGDYTVVVTNTAGEVTSTAATLTVTPAAVAPQITTQPTDQSVTVGENATFTVTATGTPAPTYQWHFDGTEISGATSASYAISSAALTNAGDYTVVVTNTAGTVTSTAATLTVTAATVAPQITTQPTDQSVTVGENATFTVTATGTPAPTYQWRFDGTAISGATSASYTLSSAALTNAGDYTVVVTNRAGTVTSSAATLTVTAADVAPQITTQPANQSVTVGENATFTVTATGTPTPTYQWRFGGTEISGATSASYTLSNAALTNAGDYTVVVTNRAGTVTSSAATLTVTAADVAPQITTQPTDQSVTVGENATFTVTATGSPTPTYQWRFGGTNINGATSASYTVSSAALTNAGDYTVVVTNRAGTVTSSAATLTVTAADVAPQITTQPTNQSVTVGENATFTVTATGTPTPTYQWRFDGSDISGATSASYTLSNAALTNAGDYTVVVTNRAGTVTSSAATLTVTAADVAPQITTQPTDQSVTVGENATFTVTATGTPTPTYQWRFGGSDIVGATSASYAISSAALTNAGDYTVVVTNTAGTVTSSAATLTVTAATVAPAITTQPTDQSVTVGENATFTVTATGTPTPTYQWHFDGTEISGATSASYTVSSAALTNAGDYTVVVTNTAGEVTSTAATLTVTAATVAPQITTQPTDQSVTVGENATFTVTATGTPAPTYQWRKDGTNISGATSATYTLSNAALTNAGDYTVVVTNTAGTVTSTAATLTVTAAGAPDLTVSVSVSSANVTAGASFTINATVNNEGSAASAAVTLSYRRSTNATITVGDTSIGTDPIGILAASGSSTQDASVSIDTAGTYWVGGCLTASAGEINLGNNCSTGVQVIVTAAPSAVAPQITTQPTSQSVTVGDSVTFTVAATGTPTPTYQWRRDGRDISGATSETYTISSAALTDTASYTVVVTNTASSVTSTAAILTVTAAAVAPQITTQPTDQSVTVGGSATFTVTATGTPTPTYQWRFEGTEIAGATSASYTLSSAALTNAGDYTVVVTNTAGTVTSTAATLTVTAAAVAPQITTQPTNQSVTVGGSATFTVAATGTPAPTYQWRKDGTNISGATSATYTLSNAALTNAGDYTVVVTNTAGTVTSTAATLTVTAAGAPDLTVSVSVSSANVTAGASFTINATVNNEGSAASAAVTLSYRRSTNATITVGDTSIGTDPIGILAASGSSTQDASVSIDTAGTYWVGGCLTASAGEINLGNNCSTGVQVIVTAAPSAVAPQITTQPTSQSVTVGDSVTFTVAATGTPTPTYQWRRDGRDISGATSETYTISSAALTDTASYTVVVTNTASSVTSTAAILTVTAAAVAPQITTQPTNQSVTVGGSATFTVAATGTPTPTYQWRKDGTAISGATSATYTLSNAALTDAGDYTVVVTNTAGTVTSTAATLTVTAADVAPQITTQPANQSVTVGENATFTVTATGTPTPTYQWRFDGTDISGATSASYTLSNAALTNAGDYTVVVTNRAGTVTSSAATLTVTAADVAPQITTQPANQSVTVGENATFTVTATGTPTPTYQWRFGGSAISGATSASYTLSNAALTNAGDYTVVVTNRAGTVTSSAATLTVTAADVAPQITTQPANQSVTVGENATFTVTATGTPTPTYQWRFDGSDISGATSASYTLSNAALTNAGDYTVVVTNRAGTVTSTAATLTVTAADVAPQITTQPTNQSVTVGENATFTVTATGTPTPTYQWRFDGSDISGATSASYTLSNAALTNAGDYTVVVTNTAGTVTSTAATLTVTAAAVAPQITTQPTDQSVTVGGSATFTVAATGTPTPTYQWRFEGSEIAGATSETYTLSNAALTNAGDYTVVVTNTVGTVTSSAATLTVTPAAVAPQITTQPVNQSVTVGGSATFTVTATGTPTPTYQWRFEGSDIDGATSASYALSSAALTNAGDYTVVVTNTAGTVTSSAATLTVTAAAVAPQITTQPTDQSVTVGENATFTVTATGTPTPTYQWRFEGSEIAGATSASYTLSNAALTNAGDYTVVVTNTAGTVTSTAATLTVTPAAVAPQITTQPTDQSVTVGENATFTVTATGTPTPTYQWRRDGTNIDGATSASYVLSNAALTNAGDYTVVVTNTAGTVTSSAATLTVTPAAVAPQITTQPTDQSVTVGENATFTVTATGTPTPTYQWRFEGSDIAGATSASYTVSSAALTDAGDYTVVVTNTAGTVTSSAATLTVTPAAVAPQITTQPTDQSVTVGGSATFTVTATGTPTPTYQWRFEGSDIAGATSASYTLSNAALTNAGDYTVVVTNTAGTVTSSAATLTVTANAEVSIGNASVAENGVNAEFTVTLSRAVSSPVVLAVTYTDGTAEVATDLGTPLPPTVTIAADTLEATLAVPIIDDTIVEGEETFTVTLSEGTTELPDGVIIADGEATGTITDNDRSRSSGGGGPSPIFDPVRVSLSPLTATVAEDVVDGNIAFTVSLNRAVNSDVVLGITYAGGTDNPVTLMDDLGTLPTTVTIEDGDTSATLTVPIIDDEFAEGDETFTVILSEDDANPLPDGVSIADGEATATIEDDDEARVALSPPTLSAIEGESFIWTVSLSAPVSRAINITWIASREAGDTATLVDDLQAPRTGTVTFAANNAGDKTFTIQPVIDEGDGENEEDETFTVTLTATDILPLPAGVVIDTQNNRSVATIINNRPATVSIADADPVAEDAGPARFTVSLSRMLDSDVVLDVSYAARTAVLADLGSPRPATVTLPANSLEATLEVPIFDDAIVEGAETFAVTVSESRITPLPVGVSIADGEATGTIALTAETSVLIEPRRTGAGTALRRHVSRFDSMTGSVVQHRLDGRETQRVSTSDNLDSGHMAVGGGFGNTDDTGETGETPWGAWLNGAWTGFGGTASGRQADVYGGMDYLGEGWLIGGLLGYEVADLDIGEATYSANYTHVGVYGGARLAGQLLFDGAATYGMATPNVALGDISASYKARRITARGAITGDFGFEYGLKNGSVTIAPQLGLLYARERLGGFTDSAGGVAEREVLELGRFSAGPRLIWDFEGGQVVGGLRMQGDFLQLDDGAEGRISGAANIGLRLDLTPNATLGIQGDVDGLGITDDFRSYGGNIELNVRF